MNAFEAAEKNGKVEELREQLVALAKSQNKGGPSSTSIDATFMRVTGFALASGETAMAFIDVSRIASWHAQCHFDAASRDAAWDFREVVTAQFGDKVEMGRFHEREVGPHPRWSYQIAFAPMQFSDVVGWLALNHGALDVFVHPNTDDELRDHRDSALWLGRSHQLNLQVLGASIF